ncbi:MAG: type I DNA topoisomerase [Bacteroidota bacterium]
MIKNLVIVESPAKAKTIENFLGPDYTVKSCFGHIRDLSKSEISIDIEKGFLPNYEIPTDKIKVVNDLKKSSKEAETVWLASDEDREGEAISWHLAEALHLDKSKVKRIVFHEITKNAITEAISHPRSINKDLVDAQQARRVLDRLVGYELSPLLWRKIRPSLSAGRVQSVALRLIVEREEEIRNFKVSTFYKVSGIFSIAKDSKTHKIKAELSSRFKTKAEAEAFLKKCIGAEFAVRDVEMKPSRKSPAPPFTTSTLQQEASRKLGFSVTKTMVVAQQLYESGKITYMRTDSVNLSNMALSMAKKEIETAYGENYVKIRNYKTKSKGAQEAHEAIRPTYLNQTSISGTKDQEKLYDLIWKRTIASQMSDAELEKTNINIGSRSFTEIFVASGEIINFDGFLKVYLESSDEEDEETQKGLLPPIVKGDVLDSDEISAMERHTLHPPRYTEASLVKKLEELGIGRPSTYAPTITTIQKREYVVIESREGVNRNFVCLVLKNNKLSEITKAENTGYEKAKLIPTDIGVLVTTFLTEHFKNILDYNFTAKVEIEFDEIADGKKIWNQMIKEFYFPFHEQVLETQKTSKKVSGERLLGLDPSTSKNVYVKLGRYGPMIQIGENTDEEKPKFVGLLKGQSIDTITLKEALALFLFPKLLGKYKDLDVTVGIGRFGPYIKHNGTFASLMKTDDPSKIILSRAIELIIEKSLKNEKIIIKEFAENADVRVLNGRYGPYLVVAKLNYKIPKDKKPEELTLADCLKISIETESTSKSKRTFGGKKTVAPKKSAATKKNTTSKKTTATKKASSTKTKSKTTRKSTK